MSDVTELTEQMYFAPETDGRDQCVNDGRDEVLNPEDMIKGVLQLMKDSISLVATKLKRMTSGSTEMTNNRIIERKEKLTQTASEISPIFAQTNALVDQNALSLSPSGRALAVRHENWAGNAGLVVEGWLGRVSMYLLVGSRPLLLW